MWIEVPLVLTERNDMLEDAGVDTGEFIHIGCINVDLITLFYPDKHRTGIVFEGCDTWQIDLTYEEFKELTMGRR